MDDSYKQFVFEFGELWQEALTELMGGEGGVDAAAVNRSLIDIKDLIDRFRGVQEGQ